MHKRILLSVAMLVLIVAGASGTWLFMHFQSSRSAPPQQQPNTPVKNALACTESLPAAVKIGQKLMAAGYSDQLADEQSVFAAMNIGGMIIMDQASSTQLTAFRDAQSITPTIAVDQEGGTVQRYKTEGRIPGATDMAAGYSTNEAYQKYTADDIFLKSIGITTNFAPVVDVSSRTPNPLPGRMYSSDPATVTSYATANVQAAQTVGLTPVIKHFPGLGSASGNTDNGSSTTDPLASLKVRDILPYQQLAKLKPDVMVSNAIVPDLTEGQPAIWSPAALSLLRSYGYQDSVVYTDSLTAKAIPGQLDAAVIKAWQAGIDVAVIVQQHDQTVNLTNDFQAIQTRATSALQSGELNNSDFSKSALRILQRKGIEPCSLQDNK